jgi:hypothetical protein
MYMLINFIYQNKVGLSKNYVKVIATEISSYHGW